MSWTEFEIIERCFTRPVTDHRVLIGIGDDAAVIDTDGPIAVAVDTLVESVHFPRNVPARAIGHRVLAVNLSDLAAMGAQPRWCTLALTLPTADSAWLTEFAAGLFALAEAHGVSLVGGDLTGGPLTVTLQLIGPVKPSALLTRGGGHVGDDVYVTGSLGDSAAGLALWQASAEPGDAEQEALKQRFLYPTPRVAEGLALGPLASAAIDVSDGLLADLGHLCTASGCGALIDVERLPLSAELLALFPPEAAQSYALTGGDDYELVFSAAPAQAQAIESAMDGLGASIRRIGRLAAGKGVVALRGGEPFAAPRRRGFEHFTR